MERKGQAGTKNPARRDFKEGVVKYILSFEIECGEKTCAAIPGKFCKYFRYDLTGRNSCYFFGELKDKDGWVQRHFKCLSSCVLEEQLEEGRSG